MGQARTYTKEFKEQALKLAKEVGNKKAAEELGVPCNTLSGWVHKAKKGEIDACFASHPLPDRICFYTKFYGVPNIFRKAALNIINSFKSVSNLKRPISKVMFDCLLDTDHLKLVLNQN